MVEESGFSSSVESGTQLGRFTLVRRIALGGMAEIWLAHEKGEGPVRPVALKVLLAPFAKDPTFRSMFLDEVQIVSRLTHENIVEIYGAFELDGHLVQAMELVDGKDLRRILSALAREGRRLPVPFAVVIARELARALGYAHTKRGEDGKPLEIVHRDVSPHNVMITFEGGVKLLDFGIAKAAERLTRTRTGVIKGKISYMAPEQALAVGVTPRTDLFALGIIFWEMLAMQRLFKADTDALVLEKVIRAEVPPIRDFNPDVPEEIAQLLHQMLAQRAQMRPDSARTVENALTRLALRHFGEQDTSKDALAGWAAQFVEEEKRTGRLVVSGIPPTSTAAPTILTEGPPMEALDTPLDGTDSTLPDAPVPEAVKALDAADATIPTLLQEEQKTLPPLLPTPSKPTNGEEHPTDPVRLPTRSEIEHAVDAQPTVPVSIDGPPRPPSSPRAPIRIREIQSTEALPTVIPVEGQDLTIPTDPTALGDLAPPSVPPGPVGSKLEKPDLGNDSDFDFEPVKIPFEEALGARAAAADDKTPPAVSASHPALVRPVSSLSDPGRSSEAEAQSGAVSSLNSVLLAGGVVAALAVVLVVAVLLRSC